MSIKNPSFYWGGGWLSVVVTVQSLLCHALVYEFNIWIFNPSPMIWQVNFSAIVFEFDFPTKSSFNLFVGWYFQSRYDWVSTKWTILGFRVEFYFTDNWVDEGCRCFFHTSILSHNTTYVKNINKKWNLKKSIDFFTIHFKLIKNPSIKRGV